MKEYVIVVAGGSGTRMGTDIPKQFLKLGPKPVLMHTLEAFYRYSAAITCVLVLPAAQFDSWHELCGQYDFGRNYLLVSGGETRYDSVKRGLDTITGAEGLVAVHDGVRPLVSPDLITRSFEAAGTYGASVTGVPLKDSIRVRSADGIYQSVNREEYRLVQTPQTFRLDWMRKAFETGYRPEFTDCASVLEHAGFPVHLIGGSYFNIKITTPEDMILAEAFLARQP